MNRLSREKSPYLLQHAENPVDWYPWGDDAFAAARRADRPIFLSVGYSTCHWCHVMAHESFENPRIAGFLNEHYVAVKVDREERPDVDRAYMTFVQATTGGGGWPMSVWLTPDLAPFYGGTYFPPISRWGRPGFLDLLEELARLWREERPRVVAAAAGMEQQGESLHRGDPAGTVPGPEVLSRAVDEYSQAFDRRFGGFGGAPKFPRPSELLFLLREHRRSGDARPLEMATATLRAMADGGVRDHVGGGFHRYSVDAQWRVPHFEKMLYDQAQLALAYLEAAQAARGPDLLAVAEDTLRYVGRVLTGPDGGFCSAEDADSVPPDADRESEGRRRHAEGAFYLWTAEEIDRLLGSDAAAFRARYGVQPEGNAPHDPQGEFARKNILYAARTLEQVAAASGRTVGQVEEAVTRGRSVLFEAREGRPRPHLDDKVLTAWNGLMIGAFARASRLSGRPEWLEQGARAARWALGRLWRPESRTLLRRYRDHEAAIEGFAEDYACLAFGLLELFEADGDPEWLERARLLQARLDELFWDDDRGGWFSTTGADPTVRLRMKDDYDGAEPSASAVAAWNALRLAHLGGDATAAGRVERTLRFFAARLTGAARSLPMVLAVLSAYHAAGPQVVIVGAGEGDGFEALCGVVDRGFAPFATCVRLRDAAAVERIGAHLPWATGMRAVAGRATAYVCRDCACQLAITDPEVLARAL